MNVFCLGPEQIDSLWDEYAHHLERLELRGDCLAIDIRDDLRFARKQLFGYQQDGKVLGVAITRIADTPRGRMCEIYGAAGTELVRGQIDEIMNEIERWAAAIGCTRVRICGRKGWLRRLNGFQQTGIIMEKQI
jgi:hypothetical protein